MYKNLKKRTEGFTIIEVLIVLAIAGLIMLIVFLAVPALQRNQRNTSRRTEVSRIGAAATEFLTNNNGTLPASATDATTIMNAVGSVQYTGGLVIATGTQSAAVTLDTPQLVTGAQCSGSATVAGSTRQMAIRYTIEPATAACLNI